MKKLFIISTLAIIGLNAKAQWIQTSLDSTYPINAFAISGSNIFAGSNGGGVYLSSNNGSSWTVMNTGLTNTDVLSLFINGNYIFAGVDVNGGDVYLSSNNGNSWSTSNKGMVNGIDVLSFAISGGNIFAGTYGGSVYLSTNNGSSWGCVGNGITPSWRDNAFVISGSNIFVGLDAGVYLSTNDGNSWTEVSNGLTNNYVLSLAISGTNIFAGTFGGGVYLSTNNGSSWTVANNGISYQDIRAIAINGNYIFAAGDGVYISSNNGNSWVNTGLTNYEVMSLAINGSYIFAGTNGGGVWKCSLNEIISCSYSISPDNVSQSTSGTSDTFSIITKFSTCPWKAISNDSWISITSGSSGIGNGKIFYTVSSNSGSSRTGTIYIKDTTGIIQDTFSVNQSGCSYSISPDTIYTTSSDTSGSFTVTNSLSCAWTATSNNSWITITSGSSGNGKLLFGSVGYKISSNSGSSRIGTISIKDSNGNLQKTFAVKQAASSSSGIQEINPQSTLTIFPNPFKESTTVRMNETFARAGYTYILFDCTGKALIRISNQTNPEINIQKGALSRGIYFLEIDGESTLRGKLMIVE